MLSNIFIIWRYSNLSRLATQLSLIPREAFSLKSSASSQCCQTNISAIPKGPFSNSKKANGNTIHLVLFWCVSGVFILVSAPLSTSPPSWSAATAAIVPAAPALIPANSPPKLARSSTLRTTASTSCTRWTTTTTSTFDGTYKPWMPVGHKIPFWPALAKSDCWSWTTTNYVNLVKVADNAAIFSYCDDRLT